MVILAYSNPHRLPAAAFGQPPFAGCKRGPHLMEPSVMLVRRT